MMRRRGLFLLLTVFAALTAVVLVLHAASANAPQMVIGTVLDAGRPVAGASVRVRATTNTVMTDENGVFVLDDLLPGEEVEIAAWYAGYYVTSTHVTPPASGVVLGLRRYHTRDHPEYEWASPISGTGACGTCHPMIIDQWQDNAHGKSISSARFFSMYNGTDVSGTIEIGPGYLLDFPDTAGVCGSCHAPGWGVDNYLTTDMNAIREEITAGIHCDYCHKVGGVYLNPATESVYPNVPGVESTRVLRPPEGENIFFGPYDDIKDPDTFLPLIAESQWCAPCHSFSFWGTPIYESYDEWLASPYAEEGVTCQDCHMPPNGDSYFALPEMGGLPHPPETIPSHLQLGAESETLLQETIEMEVTAELVGDQVVVTIDLENTGAGHHVPTDYPGRQMILLVSVTDEIGNKLPLIDGPTVPDWGGPQSGLPGTVYAKILRDVITGEAPVVSYWRHALIQSDNRIPALASDQSTYAFRIASLGASLKIKTQLLFRRVFSEVIEEKRWDVPDILMEEFELILP